jgi:uncharacterized protein (DUF1499 family)
MCPNLQSKMCIDNSNPIPFHNGLNQLEMFSSILRWLPKTAITDGDGIVHTYHRMMKLIDQLEIGIKI